jgi:superfamily II DNA/RNA helicase
MNKINNKNMEVICDKEVLESEIFDFGDTIGNYGEIKDNLLRGIYSYGLDKPSKIQSILIPQILYKKDVFAISPGGTGKTVGYLISSIQMVVENINKPQVIILAPTRELSISIINIGKELLKYINQINFVLVTGGTDRNECIISLGGIVKDKEPNTNPRQIIVGTPGRISDLSNISNTNKELFSDIKLIILDETDKLVDIHKDEISNILTKLENNNAQLCLFSSSNRNDTLEIGNKILKNSVKIIVEKEKLHHEGINKTLLTIDNSDNSDKKYNGLLELLSGISCHYIIIYTNSNEESEKLKNNLEKDLYQVDWLNILMDKYTQNDIIHNFVNKCSSRILIATDSKLSLLKSSINSFPKIIINYELPVDSNLKTNFINYTNRVGRIGHFGHKQLEINFIDKSNKNDVEFIKMIENILRIKIKEVSIKELCNNSI